MVSNNVKEPSTKITCGNAPWNRYVFTRFPNKGSFRKNEVLPSEKTVVSKKTNVNKT